MEKRRYYPNQIQVRLLEVNDRNHVSIQVYERNGSCKRMNSFSAALIETAFGQGLVDRKLTVQTENGPLELELRENGNVYVEGNAKDRTSVVLSKRMREQLTVR